MFILIGLIFIAQIIILTNIISLIIKTDKKIIAKTYTVDKDRTKLKWRLNAISEITSDINKIILPNLIKKLSAKKQNQTVIIIKRILQSSMFLYFKTNYKHALTGLKVGYFFSKGLLK